MVQRRAPKQSGRHGSVSERGNLTSYNMNAATRKSRKSSAKQNADTLDDADRTFEPKAKTHRVGLDQTRHVVPDNVTADKVRISRGIDTGKDVLANFAHLTDATKQVATLISSCSEYMARCADNEHLEIEARLGYLNDGTFESNVDEATFCSVLQLLEGYPRWTNKTEWRECQDVFYLVNLPPEYKSKREDARTQVRTSVTSNEDGELVIEHCTKQRLHFVDMELRFVDSSSCALSSSRSATNDRHDLRVTACLERQIPADLLPIAVTPEYVRIKQRKRFFLSSLGMDQNAFAFDMSIVFAGKTKSEAEQKQSSGKDMTYEIEVECLQPKEYLQTCGGEDLMLALSLILKCYDFSSTLHHSHPVTYVPVASK